MSLFTDKPVYIVDGCRTPFIKATGVPGPFKASDLAVNAAKALLLKSPISTKDIDEVIVGCVSAAADEANIARIIALRLGCPQKIPAWTVHRNCASGMQSIDSAARNIALGDADIILAGGTEAMSHHPVMLNNTMVNWLGLLQQKRSFIDKLLHFLKLRPIHFKPVIALLKGLQDPFNGMSMGQTAEQLAWRFSISRQAMDEFSVNSHQRLAKAIDSGVLTDEVTAIFTSAGEIFENDNGVRRDSSIEKLNKLKPVFDKKVGAVTAGNSAQITDGACMLLLASEKAVERHQLEPIGQLVDSQWSGVNPAEMGLGPVYAMSEIMQRHQFKSSDIDYWEINEAFAAQVLACESAWQDESFCQSELGIDSPYSPIDKDCLNIDGGGVSLGHPVGTSGARIVLHLTNVLNKNNAKLGLASLCIGGGQGGAMLIQGLRGASS